MNKYVEIHIAELFVGNQEYLITTNGVGSCIVIVLYDKLMRIGGMAHTILPKRRQQDDVDVYQHDREGRVFVKYVDQAIEVLLDEMEVLGATPEHIVAKLVGGAHMFTLLSGDNHGVGWENTQIAREELLRKGIPIETEVVGGAVGRNVRFDCSTGIVEITTKV